MKLKKEKLKEEFKEVTLVFEDEQQVDNKAYTVMKLYQDRVSKKLYDQMKELFYGFSSCMQLEMACDILYFIKRKEAFYTGCPSVDFVLSKCFQAIDKELDLLNEPDEPDEDDDQFDDELAGGISL